MALEEKRVLGAEVAAVRRADALSFISQQDAGRVDTAGKPVAILGAALDFDRLRPTGAAAVAGRIGFIGNLRTASNRDMVTHFARSVLPLVTEHYPDAEFYVFGHEAGREVLRLAALPGVVIVGSVEDQVPALESCWVTVCPLRFGSGVQNKMLESLAVGTPVVASPAASGALGVGAPVVCAELDEAFAAAVGRLLLDSDRRSELSDEGSSWVREHHSPEAAFAPLGELLATLV